MCLQVSGEMSQAIRTAYAKAPRQKCAAMLDEGQAAGVAEWQGREYGGRRGLWVLGQVL